MVRGGVVCLVADWPGGRESTSGRGGGKGCDPFRMFPCEVAQEAVNEESCCDAGSLWRQPSRMYVHVAAAVIGAEGSLSMVWFIGPGFLFRDILSDCYYPIQKMRRPYEGIV